jgi:predicted nuclease with TOPRIM domain
MLREGYAGLEELNDKLVKDVLRQRKQISDLHRELDQEKRNNINLSVADRSRKEYQQSLMQLLPDDAKAAFDRLMLTNPGKSTVSSRRRAKIESMTLGEFFDYKAREMETMAKMITKKAGLVSKQRAMIEDLEKEVAKCEEMVTLQGKQDMSSKTSSTAETTIGVDDLEVQKAQLEGDIEHLERDKARLKRRKRELEGDIQLLEGSQAVQTQENQELNSRKVQLATGNTDLEGGELVGDTELEGLEQQ